MNPTKAQAIQSLRPGAEWVLRGDELGWLDQVQPQPTHEEIQAEIERITVEIPWQELRAERNRRLAETDHLALSDQTLAPEMAAYRKALRDLPSNTADPANPVWPVNPNGGN